VSCTLYRTIESDVDLLKTDTCRSVQRRPVAGRRPLNGQPFLDVIDSFTRSSSLVESCLIYQVKNYLRQGPVAKIQAVNCPAIKLSKERCPDEIPVIPFPHHLTILQRKLLTKPYEPPTVRLSSTELVADKRDKRRFQRDGLMMLLAVLRLSPRLRRHKHTRFVPYPGER
jgi:hypothetical protein